MNLSPKSIREKILTMSYKGQSVHIPSAFSIVEILSTLYDGFVDPRIKDGNTNRFVLSKGHGTMALYAILVEFGLLNIEDLNQYFKDGSLLHGLPEVHTPGIEASTGSLGHGLPIATGMALAMKMKKWNKNIFCLVGDGEINEGPNWESMLFAHQQRLKNLIVIVDINKWQAMGMTKDILDLEDLKLKFEAFGFITSRCDGHSTHDLRANLKQLVENMSEKPRALLADTVKGKGVSFIESDNRWHYQKLTEMTYNQALMEIQNA